MTENEKVKKWFKTELSMRIEESLDAIDCEDVMDICIKALEEIQQYREIGTVEEFKALKEGGRFLEFLYNHIPPNEMEQYLSMYQAKDKVVVNGYADQCGLMPAT